MIGSTLTNHLVIMAKEPRIGLVKSRLARDIGQPAATAFARVTLRSLVMRLGRDPRWRLWLALTPNAALASRMLPAAFDRTSQGSGDLGQRMQRIFAALPPGPVVIVGSDIPAIKPHHIAQAFRSLGRADAVLGPAGDGGYWLIGLRRRPAIAKPFANVRWSTMHALADTRAGLAGRSVELLDTLHDVDDVAIYTGVRAWCGRVVHS